MRYPKPLKPGGTIGFAAPAFGCTTEPYRTAFSNALVKFEKMGYRTVIGPNVYADDGVGISSKPDACAKELNDMYSGADTDAIISCGGGELMCEIVPYIDFDRISSDDPKWFMGYSDNTNFTFLSATLADTAAVYGPCAASFGMEKWHQSLNDAIGLITGKTDIVSGYGKWELESLKDEDHPLAGYNLTEDSVIRYFPDNNTRVSMSGRLVGGCLDCLANLVGTCFDRVRDFSERYSEDGVIWFIESCDLSMVSVRRALWNLKNAGWFSNCKGFLIGRPMHFGECDLGVIDQYDAVTSILGDFQVPILMDLDIGHLPPMMPLICGSTADITADKNDISIHFTSR